MDAKLYGLDNTGNTYELVFYVSLLPKMWHVERQFKLCSFVYLLVFYNFKRWREQPMIIQCVKSLNGFKDK